MKKDKIILMALYCFTKDKITIGDPQVLPTQAKRLRDDFGQGGLRKLPKEYLKDFGYYEANEINKVDPFGGSTTIQSKVFNSQTNQVDVTYVATETLEAYKTRVKENVINPTCKSRITSSTFEYPPGSGNNFSLSETAQQNWIWMRQEIQAGNTITPMNVTTADERVITVNNDSTVLAATTAGFAVIKAYRESKAVTVAAIDSASTKQEVKDAVDAYLAG